MITSGFPNQEYSTIAPYLFIHLLPTLYNISLPVLQFSSVSKIPPLLHIHPSNYHPRCIMFLSQYFTSPLSVTFHHCFILIQPSTTHAVLYFSPSTSVSTVSIIPPLLHTHSSLCHPPCITFFSQYFSSPLSVSFHHFSIHIHPSTTHAV